MIIMHCMLNNFVGHLAWLTIFIFFMAHYLYLFYGSRDARVMWDQKTGRSRGFGFVSFRSQQV
jgi:RNA recognition motif-containing protein